MSEQTVDMLLSISRPYDGSDVTYLLAQLAAATARIAELEAQADNRAYALLMQAFDGASADLAAQTARAERAEAALSAERDERAHERQSISVAFGDALRLVHHYGHAGDGGECAENTCRIGRQFQRALAGESGGGDAEA